MFCKQKFAFIYSVGNIYYLDFMETDAQFSNYSQIKNFYVHDWSV